MIALTNGSGAIEERYAYSAYGEPVFASASGTVLADSAKDNRYTYTGREWDEELNLYHFRVRRYDAESGRFYGRDPIGFADGYNVYRFVNCDPVVGLDPFGLYDVVGIDENGRTIYLGNDGGCYIYLNNRRSPVPCPATRRNDPTGPPYVSGLNAIHQSIGKLTSMCSKCCKNCSNTDCFNDVQRLATALMTAWQEHYGYSEFPPDGDPDIFVGIGQPFSIMQQARLVHYVLESKD